MVFIFLNRARAFIRICHQFITVARQSRNQWAKHDTHNCGNSVAIIIISIMSGSRGSDDPFSSFSAVTPFYLSTSLLFTLTPSLYVWSRCLYSEQCGSRIGLSVSDIREKGTTDRISLIIWLRNYMSYVEHRKKERFSTHHAHIPRFNGQNGGADRVSTASGN